MKITTRQILNIFKTYLLFFIIFLAFEKVSEDYHHHIHFLQSYTPIALPAVCVATLSLYFKFRNQKRANKANPS